MTLLPTRSERQHLLTDAALAAVSRGWDIVPYHGLVPTAHGMVCTCTRGRHCSSPGKHPAGGPKWNENPLDFDEIEVWWQRSQVSNVAVLATLENRLLILDVEAKPHPKREEHLRWVRRIIDELRPSVHRRVHGTMTSMHVFLRWPPGVRPMSVKNVMGTPFVEILGPGRATTIAPSSHVQGKWTGPHLGDFSSMPQAPEWLMDWLSRSVAKKLKRATSKYLPLPRRTPAPTLDEVVRGFRASKGSRHDALVSLGGQLRARGLTDSRTMLSYLVDARARCENPGDITDRELRSIASWAVDLEG